MINVYPNNIPYIRQLGLGMHLLDTRGGRIELARRAKGLTPGEFRQRLQDEKGIEVTASHWSRVESNKVGISLALLEATCELLDESADWILFAKQKNTQESDIGISETASLVARIVDDITDDDLRQQIVHVAEALRGWNSERRSKDQEIAELRTEIANLKIAGKRGRG